jgi:hypothetical protein
MRLTMQKHNELLSLYCDILSMQVKILKNEFSNGYVNKKDEGLYKKRIINE